MDVLSRKRPDPPGIHQPPQLRRLVVPHSDAWKACSRSNAPPTIDSVGVSLTCTYQFQTPLAAVLRFFGGAGSTTLTLTDRTVMQLNPSAT